MMRQIKIGIGQYLYSSIEGENEWHKSIREVPWQKSPFIKGNDKFLSLPTVEGTFWDNIAILENGFGVALNHNKIKKFKENANNPEYKANIYITKDFGKNWEKNECRIKSIGGRLKKLFQAPIERFEDLIVFKKDFIAASWQDPWLFEFPDSHIIVSIDEGESWQYNCLGENNPYLAIDLHGRLLNLNEGFYLESHDCGKNWTERKFKIEWPENYPHKKTNLLRKVQFVDSNIGYALIVHWHSDMLDYIPNIGFLKTIDNGNNWELLHVFDGPSIGDVNARHTLTLNII